MAVGSQNKPLPDYERPPVIETVLGVQYDRLARLRNAHLGAFWKTLDQEQWPKVTEASLVPVQFEQFDGQGQWSRGLQFQLTQDPACRLRITNATEDRMIQVQHNRLHFNWLGEGESAYPRYESVRDGFSTALKQFNQFVADESIGELKPNQWEVTYINHIPQGTVWHTPADWGFFRPLAGVPTIESVIEGESFGGEWHFIIPQQKGRLHIEWQHGKRPQEGDNVEFVRLTFTARGALDENDAGSGPILDGLDLGREIIVRSFQGLMSDAANQYWGLKHDDN